MRAGAVLDAWAVLALLQGEGAAGTTVRRYLRRAGGGSIALHLCWINLGEVYYTLLPRLGEAQADEKLTWIKALPLTLVTVKEPLILEAARMKAQHRLSYADAFAVATARQLRAPVLTGDPEIIALPRSVVEVRPLSR